MYQIKVHFFDGKDSPCCANYALKKTGRDNFNHYYPLTIESVLKSFYMVDFLKSVPSKEQAKQLCQEMIEVMAADVFSLTKCKCNLADVLSSLPDDKHERSTNHLETDKKQVERTLGLSWRTLDDCFTFLKSIKQYTMSKRGTLSIVSSIFYPLRFSAPFTLLLIQSM